MSKKKEDKNNTDSEKQNKENVEECKLDFQKGFSPSAEKNIPFPAPYTSDPRIYIEEEVYKEIQAHSTETTSVELCGVLIGEVRFDVSGNYLYVCGSIRGEKAKNSGVNVSFTPETWDYIHKIREEKYPNYSIIGWYHTHPGLGIFLSDMDKFIQDYFFNMPFQVAMVVDPKASLNGIFAWQDGKIRPLKKCWIGKEQLQLTLGTVGGEETYREKNETGNTTSQAVVSNNGSSSSEEVSDTSFYKHSFYYLLCFNLAFLLANFLFLRNASYFASTSLHSEAREIITDWAMNQSLAYEIESLTKDINNNINQLPATFTCSVNDFKNFAHQVNFYLANIAIKSKNQANKAKEALRNIASRNSIQQLNAEEQMILMKQMVADSILLQLDPYLISLSAQPINEDRIKEVEKTLNYILSLYPEETKNQVKQKYPWIFQIK